MKKKTDALLLMAIRSIEAVERKWIGLGLSRKTEAFLQAVGIVIFSNAFALIVGLTARWLGLKPGVDIRPMPIFRGSFFVAEILLLIIALLFYLSQVRRDRYK